MNKNEFMQILAALAVFGFDNNVDDKFQLQLWFQAVKKIPFDRAKKAVIIIGKEKKTWFKTDNIPAILHEAVERVPKERKFWKCPPEIQAHHDKVRQEGHNKTMKILESYRERTEKDGPINGRIES